MLTSANISIIISKSVNFGPVAQLVRAPACHAGGRGFEPLLGRCYRSTIIVGRFQGRLAQLGERLPYKQDVGGSSPSMPIIHKAGVEPVFLFSSFIGEWLSLVERLLRE